MGGGGALMEYGQLKPGVGGGVGGRGGHRWSMDDLNQVWEEVWEGGGALMEYGRLEPGVEGKLWEKGPFAALRFMNELNQVWEG